MQSGRFSPINLVRANVVQDSHSIVPEKKQSWTTYIVQISFWTIFWKSMQSHQFTMKQFSPSISSRQNFLFSKIQFSPETIKSRPMCSKYNQSVFSPAFSITPTKLLNVRKPYVRLAQLRLYILLGLFSKKLFSSTLSNTELLIDNCFP